MKKIFYTVMMKLSYWINTLNGIRICIKTGNLLITLVGIKLGQLASLDFYGKKACIDIKKGYSGGI